MKMPPFKSNAQRKFLYANNPKLAEKFEKETPKDKKLPEKVVQSPKRVTIKKIGKI